MTAEQKRLADLKWKKWGPYVSNREWGLVREDYSENGDAWNFTNYFNAESYAYRWAEEGICGICDDKQLLVFSVGFWNKKDLIIKERLFGLSNSQGNHGEDVKEYYYYLDNTPTHSYQKMLYKYPQNEFPYADLIKKNAEAGKEDPEYELIDTGIFEQNEYFDIFIEYVKNGPEDILIKLTVCNRANAETSLLLLPTLWFRNTWNLGYDDYKPRFQSNKTSQITIDHKDINLKNLYSNSSAKALFCDNETNPNKIRQERTSATYFKDGINDFIIKSDNNAINEENTGTKVAFLIDENFGALETKTFDFRLCDTDLDRPFSDFEILFDQREKEADLFYAEIQKGIETEDEKLVQRQAFAGLLWSKQLYHYNVDKWLKGDKNNSPDRTSNIRNEDWETFNANDIISMPDKWEYPWFATWDLAFHTISFALIDPAFAKQQLKLLTLDWFMHPNGQLPAYEWNFNDVNPPVHAWAAFRVFKIDETLKGKPDIEFLEGVFQKLLMNFTWWVNKKDVNGNNIFEGGFLGLDNIGVFDRNMKMPDGESLEQADGTSWMAMFSLNMMRIAMELALYNKVYEDLATKFFEHFLSIAKALDNMGEEHRGLWDEEDEFFYDAISKKDGSCLFLKLRTIVGLIPMFAVEVIDDEMLQKLPKFKARMQWVLENKPDLASLVSHWEEKGSGSKHLLSLLRGHRLKRLLFRMLDEKEFLGEFGVRALSKIYDENPFHIDLDSQDYCVKYLAAESDSYMFGGNSNWRGPIWFPVNFLIIESLQRFFFYYSPDFKVEYPTGSGKYYDLDEIATSLGDRLKNIFLKDKEGKRVFNRQYPKFQEDPDFRDYILFYEYFHGDSGRGVGASHQTGWTAIIAKLLQPRLSKKEMDKNDTESPF